MSPVPETVGRFRIEEQIGNLDAPLQPDWAAEISLKLAQAISTSVIISHNTAALLGESIWRWGAESATFPSSRDGMKGIVCGCYDPKRQVILVGCFVNRIRRFSVSGQLLASSRRWLPTAHVPETAHQTTTIKLSPDRRNLLTGGETGHVTTWNKELLRYLGTLVPANFDGIIESVSIGRCFNQDAIMIHQLAEQIYDKVDTRWSMIIRVPSQQQPTTPHRMNEND